jgi:hypothetical protein
MVQPLSTVTRLFFYVWLFVLPLCFRYFLITCLLFSTPANILTVHLDSWSLIQWPRGHSCLTASPFSCTLTIFTWIPFNVPSCWSAFHFACPPTFMHAHHLLSLSNVLPAVMDVGACLCLCLPFLSIHLPLLSACLCACTSTPFCLSAFLPACPKYSKGCTVSFLPAPLSVLLYLL